jgi:uncharacterized phage-like protein YoqJ
MIVAFTGHRPNKLGGYDLPNPTYIKVCQEIEKNLKALNPDKVITGMALGVDQWAANIAHKLNIPFIAAVPFKDQESRWPQKSQKIYAKLIGLASEVIIVSPGTYSYEKMQIRNKWMVDNCNKLIAVWDGTTGGTGNCVEYAKSVKNDEDIIYINPTLTEKSE